MTQLNSVGAALGQLPGVHAMTDVTGFALAGHLLEVARGSGLRAVVSAGQVRRGGGGEQCGSGTGQGGARH
jgi:selenide,water dikinase